MKLFCLFLREEKGGALGEYVLIIALIALVVITAVTAVGIKLTGAFSSIAGAI